MARNGLLVDTVAMLNSAVQEMHSFFDTEMGWLNPKIKEATAISNIVASTVLTVKESTVQLTRLFKQKGAELESLQKKKSSDEHSRMQMQKEKKQWESKMRKLEARMQRGTRMAKIAASACVNTREENEKIEKDTEKITREIKEQETEIEKEQISVEALYDKLEEITSLLHTANSVGSESENINMRLNQQIMMKKKEQEELMTRLENNGYNTLNLQAVSRDVKRMQKKLKDETLRQQELEEDYQATEQRLFELELQETERNILLGIDPNKEDGENDGEGVEDGNDDDTDDEGNRAGGVSDDTDDDTNDNSNDSVDSSASGQDDDSDEHSVDILNFSDDERDGDDDWGRSTIF